MQHWHWLVTENTTPTEVRKNILGRENIPDRMKGEVKETNWRILNLEKEIMAE